MHVFPGHDGADIHFRVTEDPLSALPATCSPTLRIPVLSASHPHACQVRRKYAERQRQGSVGADALSNCTRCACVALQRVCLTGVAQIEGQLSIHELGKACREGDKGAYESVAFDDGKWKVRATVRSAAEGCSLTTRSSSSCTLPTAATQIPESLAIWAYISLRVVKDPIPKQ